MGKHESNIYYVGFFSHDLLKDENRSVFRTALIPMLYVTSAIKRSGHSLTRVSVSVTRGKHSCPGHIMEIDENEKNIFFKSCGKSGKISTLFSIVQNKFEIIKFFFKNVRKSDTVIVYHSLYYLKLVLFLRKIIGFRLVLEVAEIYSDVYGTEKMRKKELKNCTQADAFLFFSELLEETVNTEKKPFVITYGTYFSEPVYEKNMFSNDGNDRIKHLVFAGTFSHQKGAATAASLGKYLPRDYHIHIIGSGTDEEKKALQEIIDQNNSDCTARVSLDGYFSGEDYKRFLQNCDIGLCTQDSNAKFNATSFPSKVTSYLSNGLRVVAVRMPALEKSEVNDILYYYDGNDPMAIVEAILGIDWNDNYDSRQVLRDLDEKFVRDIGNLLSHD